MTGKEFSSRNDVDIIDPSGRVMFFSIRRFIDNVVGENVCFICGADLNSVGFNDEHVIPDWILREYNLHNRRITLPNEAGLQYGQYKVACCVDCNSRMSVVFERPISNLVRQGLNAFTDYLLGGGLSHVFQWLALIYLKTHLKDRHLRLWLDRRKSDQTVADLYDWGELHHIHCIARAFYTGADIAPEALGSIVVWPARNIEPDVNFDYADCYEGSTILLRLGEIALLAVLKRFMRNLESDAERVWAPCRPAFVHATARIDGPNGVHQHLSAKTPAAVFNVRESVLSPGLPEHSRGSWQVHHCCRFPRHTRPPEVHSQALGKMLALYVRGPAESHLGKEGCEELMKQLEDGQHSLIFGSEGQFLVNPLPLDGEVLRPVRMNFSHS